MTIIYKEVIFYEIEKSEPSSRDTIPLLQNSCEALNS